MNFLGIEIGKRGERLDSITPKDTDQFQDRRLSLAAGIANVNLNQLNLQAIGAEMSGSKVDWHGNASGKRRVSVERAAAKETAEKEVHDRGVEHENRWHANDSSSELNSRGQLPCRRRKNSIHS